MTFKGSFKNFLAIAVLAVFASFSYAQQTVDPTVGGTCSIINPTPFLQAQTGWFYCNPSALASATGTWQRMTPGHNAITYTVAYTNATLVAAAALTADVNLVTLPAGTMIESVLIADKVTWAGAATLTVSAGDATSNTQFTSTLNLLTTASNSTYVVGASAAMGTLAADTVRLHFIATTNNLSTLTAGSLQVTLNYTLPPPGSITIAGVTSYHGVAPETFALFPRRSIMASLISSRRQFLCS